MTARSTRTPFGAELERHVDALLVSHEAWLAAIAEHRTAISHADAVAIDVAMRAQVAQRDNVIQLQTAVATLLQDDGGANGATIRAAAATLPEPARSRVTEKAVRLREMLARVQREQSVVHGASRALLAHMRGVITQVAAAMNHAGVYGREGKVCAGPVVVSALDIRH